MFMMIIVPLHVVLYIFQCGRSQRKRTKSSSRPTPRAQKTRYPKRRQAKGFRRCSRIPLPEIPTTSTELRKRSWRGQASPCSTPPIKQIKRTKKKCVVLIVVFWLFKSPINTLESMTVGGSCVGACERWSSNDVVHVHVGSPIGRSPVLVSSPCSLEFSFLFLFCTIMPGRSVQDC